jgi:hypothetical protein
MKRVNEKSYGKISAKKVDFLLATKIIESVSIPNAIQFL